MSVTRNCVKSKRASRLASKPPMSEDRDPNLVRAEHAHVHRLARALVEEAWNLGAQPVVLHVEYEGADWEVSVRVKRTEEE